MVVHAIFMLFSFILHLILLTKVSFSLLLKDEVAAVKIIGVFLSSKTLWILLNLCLDIDL